MGPEVHLTAAQLWAVMNPAIKAMIAGVVVALSILSVIAVVVEVIWRRATR